MASDQTLADLPVGASGIVVQVRCPRRVSCRLMEMGVLPGTRVHVVRVAPLGDPIMLSVRSYNLSIRRREAAGIVLTDVLEAAAETVGAVASGALSTKRVERT